MSEHFSCLKQWGAPDEADLRKETFNVLTLMTNIENCMGGSKQTCLLCSSFCSIASCALYKRF